MTPGLLVGGGLDTYRPTRSPPARADNPVPGHALRATTVAASGVRAGWAGVHGGGGEPADVGEQVVLGVVGNVVGGDQGQVRVDGDGGLGAQGVPDPADA